MQPQGTAVFNPAYLQNITAQINGLANNVNAVNPCATIQAIVNEAMAEVQAEINAIEAQIASLSVIITLPTNLAGVIGWISNFMAPTIRANEAYIQQLVQMLAAISALSAAILAAASSIHNCSINIPAPVVSVSLPA